ncbi:MAG: AGE family epimerase/isomerase, partial [Hyphomonadaceae bacterium]|nr:AGE family epimerase/isomerase [Hyphomonadaceae bacterium]
MQSLLKQIHGWMFDTALPWWTSNGIDRANGGYVEHFDLDGRDAQAPFKRTRVTCRQIYVFSHAAQLGFTPGAELAAHGMRHLTEKAWLGTGIGFARHTTRTGEVLDPTQDLYDLAFALFAFGWYLRASGERSALNWAHLTLDVIEAKLGHPNGEGFQHEVPATGWRQQNPHMHLIEAALSVYEASGVERFAVLANEIASLFQTKFFDSASTTLCEFFRDDWSRAPGEHGRIIEPGHQFEWAWILVNAKRLVGIDLSTEIRSLVGFGERFGVDRETGLTYNSVNDIGVPIDRGSRSWPNTERLKAAIALYE